MTTIQTLNNRINHVEEEMVDLKTKYENAAKDRNAVGIHLLDRNDELCILYERLNIQQDIMNKGEAALKEREEELRELNLLAMELKRKIELEKKSLPKYTETNHKAKELDAQIMKIRKDVTKLSIKMESPNDPNRCRFLKGKDLDRQELIKKIQQLEGLLAEKEVTIYEILITQFLLGHKMNRKKFWRKIWFWRRLLL